MAHLRERDQVPAAERAERTLYAALCDQVARHDVISFDVFDTLMFRAVAEPADVFALVKLRLLASDAALYDPQIVDAFPGLRAQAERRTRDAMERAGRPNCEVTLDEIYQTIAALSGAGTELIALLKRTELAVERELVYPNSLAKSLFAHARAQRKTIVLCSDMYLPPAEIAVLLRRCGYDGYDALYVSCEHARSKHAGTLFAYVAERHGVAPARVLHVGDNAHADCAMARRAGCSAVHLPCPEPPQRARSPWNDEPPFYRDTVAAIVTGIQGKRARDGAHGDADPWEALGFRVFGPLFTGFLLWLAAAVHERRPEKILFLARDAHFMREHLGAFLGLAPGELDMEYVYASRGSLLMPSLTDFAPPRLECLFAGKATATVEQHLRRLGLVAELCADAARSAGFASLDEVSLDGDPRMRALLGTLYHELLCAALERRPAVRRYLAQCIGGAKRIMLVDVGWAGNVQASIMRLLGPEQAGVEIAGHYVAVFRWAAANAYPGHTLHGWLLRGEDRLEIEQLLWGPGAIEILEFAMRGPHGTTLGYEETASGTIVPVIESAVAEDAVSRCAARLQQGAADFVAEFLAAFGSIPPEGLNSRAWAAEFFRLVTDPKPAEAALLGDVTHAELAGDTSIRRPLAPAIASSADASARLAACYWKAGFVVRNGLEHDDTFPEGARIRAARELLHGPP